MLSCVFSMAIALVSWITAPLLRGRPVGRPCDATKLGGNVDDYAPPALRRCGWRCSKTCLSIDAEPPFSVRSSFPPQLPSVHAWPRNVPSYLARPALLPCPRLLSSRRRDRRYQSQAQRRHRFRRRTQFFHACSRCGTGGSDRHTGSLCVKSVCDRSADPAATADDDAFVPQAFPVICSSFRCPIYGIAGKASQLWHSINSSHSYRIVIVSLTAAPVTSWIRAADF